MTNSHAAGWSSDAPTAAQLKEFFAQIESGRIRKEDLQKFLREKCLHHKDAKEILGENNVFDYDDWWKYCKVIPSGVDTFSSSWLPWSEKTIRDVVINQPHFLFKGTTFYAGKRLDLLELEKIFQNQFPSFSKIAYYDPIIASSTCEQRWYLMTIDPLIGTPGENLGTQERLMSNSYEIPTTIERVVANFLYFLKNGKYMDLAYRVRTREHIIVSGEGITSSVTTYEKGNLAVYPVSTGSNSRIGLAASLKISEF